MTVSTKLLPMQTFVLNPYWIAREEGGRSGKSLKRSIHEAFPDIQSIPHLENERSQSKSIHHELISCKKSSLKQWRCAHNPKWKCAWKGVDWTARWLWFECWMSPLHGFPCFYTILSKKRSESEAKCCALVLLSMFHSWHPSKVVDLGGNKNGVERNEGCTSSQVI